MDRGLYLLYYKLNPETSNFNKPTIPLYISWNIDIEEDGLLSFYYIIVLLFW